MATDNITVNDNLGNVSKHAAELSTKLHQTAVNAQQLGNNFKNLTALVTGEALAFKKINDTLVTFNKTLYDLSRQGKVAGQSFSEIKKAIEDIGSTTSLSKKEAAEFVKTFQDVKGIRLSANALRDFAKALTSEFGPALDDVKGAMSDLIAIQQKDVDILNKVRAGMGTKEVIDYAMSMEALGEISEQQGDSLIRAAEAMQKHGGQLSEEEKKLRRATEAQQKLSKAWEDVKVDWAEKLADLLPRIDETLANIVSSFKSIPTPVLSALAKLAIAGGALHIAGGMVKVATGGKGIGGIGATGASGAGGMLSRLIPGAGAAVPGTTPVFDEKVFNAVASNAERQIQATSAATSMGKQNAVMTQKTLLDIKKGPTVESVAKYYKDAGGAGGILKRGAGDVWGGLKGGLGSLGRGITSINDTLNQSPLLKAGVGFTIASFGPDAEKYLREKGQDRLGAAAGAAAKIGGYAMMGSAVGGPLGAGLGAALGVLSSTEQLGEAIGEVSPLLSPLAAGLRDQYEMGIQARQQAKLLKDTYGKEVREMPGFWTKTKESVLGGARVKLGLERKNYIKEAEEADIFKDYAQKRYGKEYGELTGKEQGQIKTDVRGAQERRKGLGVEGQDVGAFYAKLLQEELAREAAQQLVNDNKIQAENKEAMVQAYMAGNLALSSDLVKAIGELKPGAKGAAKQKALAVAGVAADMEGMGAEAQSEAFDKQTKEVEKATSSLEVQRKLYQQIRAEVEFTTRRVADQVQAHEKIANYLLKYRDNLSGAENEYQKIINVKNIELQQIQKAIELRGKNNNEAINESILANELAKGLGLTQEEALAKVKDSKILKSDINVLVGKEKDIQGDIIATMMKQNDLVEVRKGVIEANMSLIESEINLTKQMYLGLGPTLNAQMKLVDQIEAQLALVDEQILKQQKLQATGKGGPEVQKRILELQLQRNQLVSKELETTKNLREGYLDAMGAFTNVEGAFAKVIQKREQGFGEMVRRFGVQGGLKAGAGGAGGTAPMMQWGPGGQLSLEGMEAMEARRSGYGGLGPIRGRVGTAQAYEAAGPGAFSMMLAGKDAGIRMEGKQRKFYGGEGAGTLSGGATGGFAVGVEGELQKLNEKMSEYVTVGIQNAGGSMSGGMGDAHLPGQLKERVKKEAQAAKEAAMVGATVGDAHLPSRDIEEKKKYDEYENTLKKEKEKTNESQKIVTNWAENILKGRRGDATTTQERVGAIAQGKERILTQPLRKAQAELEKTIEMRKGKERAIKEMEALPGTDQRDLQKQKSILENIKTKEARQQEKVEKTSLDLQKSIEKLAGATKDNTKVVGEEIEYAGMAESRKASGYALTEYSGPDYGEDLSLAPDEMAIGGFVAGSGTKDTVPAMLTPGEHITNARAAKKHAALLKAINANRFADGGFVSGLSGPTAPPIGSSGGGFSPNIAISVKGESVNKMTRMVMNQLSGQLNKMMRPSGTTARFHDYTST